jgi:hypothetical protein
MIDDKTLREVLQRKIAQLKEYPRSAQKEVEMVMANKYNVKFSTTVDIFNGFLPIESMGYDMLYKLMTAIHEVTLERCQDLDPSDLYAPKYFTEQELESKIYDKPLDENNDDFDIVIDEWNQITNDQYHFIASSDEVLKWTNLNKLKYNPNVQRDLKVKVNKGTEIMVVDINTDAVKEMEDLIENNEFFSDNLTINVNPDLYEEPKIVKNKLIIPKESHIDLIDGFHRCLALMNVKRRKSDLKFTFQFNLTVFNEEKANKYMLQMDKKNHLSEEQVIRTNKNNFNNLVVTRLKDSSSFHLKKSLLNDSMFTYVVKLIEKIFNIKERPKAVDLYKNIEKNINIFVEEDNLYEREFTKQEWFVYLYILKYSIDSNINFINLINSIKIYSTLEKMKFIKEPSAKYYKILDKVLSEVNDNANV